MSITFDARWNTASKQVSSSSKPTRSALFSGEHVASDPAFQRFAMVNVVRDSTSLTYSRLGAFAPTQNRGRHVEAIG